MPKPTRCLLLAVQPLGAHIPVWAEANLRKMRRYSHSGRHNTSGSHTTSPCDETRANHDPSQMNWAESGRLALQMFNEAEVEFEPVHKTLAAEEGLLTL